MPPPLQQISRSTLPGPTPLEFLRRFPAVDLACFYSGNNAGHSVIARRRLASHTVAHLPGGPCDGAAFLDRYFADLFNPCLRFAAAPAPLAAFLGYISYDLAYALESIGNPAADDASWPLLHFAAYREYFLYDHATGLWSLYAWSDEPQALDAMAAELARKVIPPPPSATPPSTLTASLPRETYLSHVARIKEYIAAGDIYQANYAQRWSVHPDLPPRDIFLKLCQESPAEFSALIVDSNHALISASPELFLQRHGNHLATRPIKGTRPRDPQDPVHDAALRDDLLASPKDKAELAMIVDLLRNDLGRVAQFGSVKVTAPRALEPHPTVWHTAATVEADLRPCTSWPDIIRALCPGGSITGAPKIRAMQILNELEPHRRNVYCGNIAAISPAGNAVLNIAIRTIQMIGPTAHIWAGGGIVADSNPQHEYEECHHKAAALFRALGLEPPTTKP